MRALAARRAVSLLDAGWNLEVNRKPQPLRPYSAFELRGPQPLRGASRVAALQACCARRAPARSLSRAVLAALFAEGAAPWALQTERTEPARDKNELLAQSETTPPPQLQKRIKPLARNVLAYHPTRRGPDALL